MGRILILLLLLLVGCKPNPDATSFVDKGYVNDIWKLQEFTYEKCQYLILNGKGISHKGNCTNNIHKSNEH